MKRCTICNKRIPEVRLELAPNTVTCSRECSRRHTLNLKALANRSYRERQKAMREPPKP